mmetsp:Transcript_14428/g.17108  ORF Transcript_14428/g.17108 Transcript_14428/m.17108 type:complete len:120 (+) Transcript_14428:114-473(+)
MGDNRRDVINTFRSLTGHLAQEREALSLSAKGDDIGALQMSRRVVKTRLYHANTPPYICSVDIGKAHTALARILQKIINKLGGANENLQRKYRAEAATNYYSAWEITRTEEAWDLFVNV